MTFQDHRAEQIDNFGSEISEWILPPDLNITSDQPFNPSELNLSDFNPSDFNLSDSNWLDNTDYDDEDPSEAPREVSESDTLAYAQDARKDHISLDDRCTSSYSGQNCTPSSSMAPGITLSSSPHFSSSFPPDNLSDPSTLITMGEIRSDDNNGTDLFCVPGPMFQESVASKHVSGPSGVLDDQFGEFSWLQSNQNDVLVMNTESQTATDSVPYGSLGDLGQSLTFNQGLWPFTTSYTSLLTRDPDPSSGTNCSFPSPTEGYDIQLSSRLNVNPDPPSVCEQEAEQSKKRKRKPFTREGREKTKRVRDAGACVRCRIYKEPVWARFHRNSDVLIFL